MLRDHCWMASTGLNGTITSPSTLGSSPSSTMRTCCWESPEWGRSRSSTTPAMSTVTSETRLPNVSTFTTRRKRATLTLASSTALRKLLFAVSFRPKHRALRALIEMISSLQLELPHRETNQRFLPLGLDDNIQRSRILSRPEANQRGERHRPEGPAGQPVAGPRDQSALHWLLHLQRQH